MSAPVLASSDAFGRRFYTWPKAGGDLYWSVTEIIGAGIPKHLVPWASKILAELVLADVKKHGKRALRRWDKAGRAYVEELRAGGMKLADAGKAEDDFILRWLKGASDRVRDAAATKGSDVHDAAERFVLQHGAETARTILRGDPMPAWPEEIRPHMENAWVPWVRRYRPEFLATEFTVFNRAQAYGGTGDTIVRAKTSRGLEVILTDYKSGRATYAEVGPQLAAYRRGEFIGSPDGITELPMPGVDDTAVLHLTPKGPSFRRVRTDDEVFRVFLFAREIFRFREEIARNVIGDEIEPELEDALTASLAQLAAVG